LIFIFYFCHHSSISQVLKYISILVILIFAEVSVSAQKNSVKIFGWYSPYVANSNLMIASVGYSKDITGYLSLDIVAKYTYAVRNNSKEDYNSRVSLMPAVRYYANGNNAGFWLSGFPVIGIYDNSTTTKYYRTFEYGIGLGAGFRPDISKNRKWFMDIGFDISYRISDIVFYHDELSLDPTLGSYSIVENSYDYPPSELFVPGFIIQLGYRF